MVNRFILQWHITEACNLKCKHCYQKDHQPVQLDYPQLLNILDQYKELLNKLNMKGHINLTGGEPLVSPFLFPLLKQFNEDNELYTFSLLTNGVLIDEELAFRLACFRPVYVQVSLEGDKKTNDDIRGKGTYNKIAKAIKHLKTNNIYVSLSFTAHHSNYRQFPQVVKYALRNRVNNVWSDRYIPLDDDKSIQPLNKEETQEYLKIMQKEKIKLFNKRITTTNISMYRALQFQMTNDFPYACTAGDTLLTVSENGDLLPCRRMPIVVGNLLCENMYELYKNDQFLRQLREYNIPDDCRSCEHEELCQGGLKCLTMAFYGDLNHRDIGCDVEIL